MTLGINLKKNNDKNLSLMEWNHQNGWPVTLQVNVSHDNNIFNPVICDLEGDNSLDVVVSYSFSETESYIDAYSLNGFQKTDLGFPFMVPGKMLAEVSVGDLDNDGNTEIVASVPVLTDTIHTTIYVFKYDGDKFVESWHFKETRETGEVLHSPTIGDIDGDGDLEIVTGNQRNILDWRGVVYAFHHDGTMVSGWPVSSIKKSGSYYATPALGDINNDGFLEVVVGTYFLFLYAWDGNGKLVSKNWPVRLPDDNRAHSVQIGDLDGDSKLEIVQIGGKYGDIYIFDGNGNTINSISPETPDFSCTPALGDIDGDGDLEIFVNIGDYIYGWHHNGNKVAGSWPVFINNNARSSRVSIIIGDVDSDHLPDIIYMRENLEDGSDIFAFHSDGALIDGWPYSFEKANDLRSSPTLIDIDSDGDLELVFSYSYIKSSPNPSIYTIDILDLNSTYNPSTMHWPMFQNNPKHSGLYQKPGNNPPEEPVLNGPINGKVGTDYTFTALTNDSDGDNISYLFDWGDGTNSGWTEFVKSGTIVNQSHKWLRKSTFKIRVKAKDCYASQSKWTTLEVKIPRNKQVNNFQWSRFLERFPILQKLFHLIK